MYTIIVRYIDKDLTGSLFIKTATDPTSGLQAPSHLTVPKNGFYTTPIFDFDSTLGFKNPTVTSSKVEEGKAPLFFYMVELGSNENLPADMDIGSTESLLIKLEYTNDKVAKA